MERQRVNTYGKNTASSISRGQSDKGFFIQFLPKWIPFARSDEDFMEFISSVLDVLDLPDPPPPSPTGSFCNY